MERKQQNQKGERIITQSFLPSFLSPWLEFDPPPPTNPLLHRMKRNDFKCPKSLQKSRYLVTYLSTYLPINRFWTFQIVKWPLKAWKDNLKPFFFLSCNTFILSTCYNPAKFQQGFLFSFFFLLSNFVTSKSCQTLCQKLENFVKFTSSKKRSQHFDGKNDKFFRKNKHQFQVPTSDLFIYFQFCDFASFTSMPREI